MEINCNYILTDFLGDFFKSTPKKFYRMSFISLPINYINGNAEKTKFF